MVIKRNDINIKSLRSKGRNEEDSRGQGGAGNDGETLIPSFILWHKHQIQHASARSVRLWVRHCKRAPAPPANPPASPPRR